MVDSFLCIDCDFLDIEGCLLFLNNTLNWLAFVLGLFADHLVIFLVSRGILFTVLSLFFGRLCLGLITLRDDLLLDLLSGIHFHLGVGLLLHHFLSFLLGFLSFCKGSETLLFLLTECLFFALLLS